MPGAPTVRGVMERLSGLFGRSQEEAKGHEGGRTRFRQLGKILVLSQNCKQRRLRKGFDSMVDTAIKTVEVFSTMRNDVPKIVCGGQRVHVSLLRIKALSLFSLSL